MFRIQLFARLYLCVWLTLASVRLVSGQSVAPDSADRQFPVSLTELEHHEYTSIWLNSLNPAGLSVNGIDDVGNLIFYYCTDHGDFYRPQEPERSRRGGGYVERYQSLGKMRFKGDFRFENTSEKNRRWTSVREPYRGTPYVLADERGGDWAAQNYSMSFTAASGRISEFMYAGISMGYELNTGARQNDPRPLINSNDIYLRPGLIIPTGAISLLGLTGYYSTRNEEINISVVNRDYQHRFYKLRGLGEFRTGFMTSFTRVYNNSSWGGGINYSMNLNDVDLFFEGSYINSSEDITDGISAPQHGGEYDDTFINSTLTIRYRRNGNMSVIKGFLEYTDGKGTEHSQQYDSSLEKWITFATNPRFTGQSYHAGIIYDYFRRVATRPFSWTAGIQAHLTAYEKQFLLPNSTQVNQRFILALRAGKNISLTTTTLYLNPTASYNMSLDNTLSINSELLNSDRSIITENITIPDYEYLATDYLRLGLSATINFKQLKFTDNIYYLRSSAYYYTMTNFGTNGIYNDTSRLLLNISIGMIYE